MIWHLQHASKTQRETLVDHIASEVSDVVETGMSLARCDLEEMARAVAFYLDNHHPSAHVRSDYLLLLVSRALIALGEESAAEQLVEGGGRELDLPAGTRALLARGAVRPGTWRLFAHRLARPSRWAAESEKTVWVLDMDRLELRADDCLELALSQGVRSIIEQLAAVWDASRGAGVLGLRNVKGALASLLGAPVGKGRLAALAEEVKAWCEQQLDAVRLVRHWRERPLVCSLDV